MVSWWIKWEKRLDLVSRSKISQTYNVSVTCTPHYNRAFQSMLRMVDWMSGRLIKLYSALCSPRKWQWGKGNYCVIWNGLYALVREAIPKLLILYFAFFSGFFLVGEAGGTSYVAQHLLLAGTEESYGILEIKSRLTAWKASILLAFHSFSGPASDIRMHSDILRFLVFFFLLQYIGMRNPNHKRLILLSVPHAFQCKWFVQQKEIYLLHSWVCRPRFHL